LSQRIVVTGGAGFIGRALVRQLAARGDEIVALVRDPDRASFLAGPHVRLERRDLTDVAGLVAAMAGADAVVHAAGVYRVGIPAADRPTMLDANLGTTERVMDAAIRAGVARMVYVSSVVIFGNTRGRIVDETYRRDPADGFVSYYDQTKWLAHLAVEERIANGAPIVIVQPGVVFGPGDHTGIGRNLEQSYQGTAPFIGLGGLGVSLVHVDDLAAGIVVALDRGQPGRAYVLAGHNVRFAEAMATAAAAGGRRPPRLRVPDLILRVGARLAPSQGALFGLDPNLREIVESSIGVTYWASSARASAELGYAPRDLAAGFADAYGGPRPADA
jgi:nucleoside-diphosphate-sugar epimerase